MKVDIRMKSAGPQGEDETFIKKRTQANLYEKGPKFGGCFGKRIVKAITKGLPESWLTFQ